MKENKINFLTYKSRRPSLQTRKNCIDLFTMCELQELVKFKDDIQNENIFEEGQFISNDRLIFTQGLREKEHYLNTYVITRLGNYRAGITFQEDEIGCVILSSMDEPPYKIYDTFFLTEDHIDNYKGTGESTTVGLWVANQFVLVDSCNSVIPYINKEWSIGNLENQIANKTRDGVLHVQQGGKYLDNMYFLASTFGSIVVPTFTEKSLVIDPKIIERRNELYRQYGDKLNDPVVMSMVEQELIKMDKDYLKTDDSYGFYGDSGKKFNTHRKRQYIAVGMVETFEKTKGKYDFIPKSLAEGWDIESFAATANEIRRGSYNRGIETADSGVLTKYMLRLFQNSKIIGEDCGDTRGVSLQLTEDIINDFFGRHVIINSSTTTRIITEANKQDFIGKTIRVRSPMYCVQEGGYCYKCAGEFFRKMEFEALGSLPLELGAAFLTLPMKAMHGTSFNTYIIETLDPFII